jgi:nucleotide-binding universal stress UspA family protein
MQSAQPLGLEPKTTKRKEDRMYRKILVPLDGSARAEKILPHVEGLARSESCEVRLLQVVEPIVEVNSADLFVPHGEQFTAAMKIAQTYIDSVAKRLAAKGISASGWAISGGVIDTICKVAEQEKADLIAMASHGRTGAGRVFYGSVASGVLHRVDRPLLIIRSRNA